MFKSCRPDQRQSSQMAVFLLFSEILPQRSNAVLNADELIEILFGCCIFPPFGGHNIHKIPNEGDPREYFSYQKAAQKTLETMETGYLDHWGLRLGGIDGMARHAPVRTNGEADDERTACPGNVR
ncbi:hypothetical protein [Fontibacillus sp. BL9]|uniref:hypothetical protein n=1 Tax=Fontibacillus sp. BL9 TaxID=3389971 RepID=UPI003978238F